MSSAMLAISRLEDAARVIRNPVRAEAFAILAVLMIAPGGFLQQESTGPRIYLPHNYRDPPEAPFVPAPPPHVVEIEGEAAEQESQAEPWQSTKVKAAR
jgi:hypothetical protein